MRLSIPHKSYDGWAVWGRWKAGWAGGRRALAYQSEGILVTFEITAVRGGMREGEKLEASEGGVILIGIRDGVRACVRENTGTIRSDRAARWCGNGRGD